MTVENQSPLTAQGRVSWANSSSSSSSLSLSLSGRDSRESRVLDGSLDGSSEAGAPQSRPGATRLREVVRAARETSAGRTFESSAEKARPARQRIKLRSSGGLGAHLLLPVGQPHRAVQRLLVAVHGVTRNRRHLSEELVRDLPGDVAVLLPYFSQRRFRGYQRLEPGASGASPAEELCSLLRLVRSRYEVDERVDLFGFSGGAQFAHRFAIMRPELVESLIVVAAGYYTMPDPRRDFPYGFSPAGALRRAPTPARWRRYLEIPKQVLVGEFDCRDDRHLRRSRELDQEQGVDRVCRARRFAMVMRSHELRQLGLARTRFALLPSCAHSFRECMRVGGLARFLPGGVVHTRGVVGERS